MPNCLSYMKPPLVLQRYDLRAHVFYADVEALFHGQDHPVDLFFRAPELHAFSYYRSTDRIIHDLRYSSSLKYAFR